MTTFRWFDGNLGFYDYNMLASYDKVSHSATQVVYRSTFDDSGAYDPFRIQFNIAGGELWDDPAGGGTSHVAGTITGITYFNNAGTKIAEITGLTANAAAAFSLLTNHYDPEVANTNFWNYVRGVNPQGALFIGSDATGRADLEGYIFRSFELGDDITTTTGNDTVQAGGDSDYISDMGGVDVYNGGTGAADLVSYHVWRSIQLVPQTGIVADLAAGTVTGPDGKVDQLTSIEGLRGTHFADVIRGSAAKNFLIGGAGGDILDGRGGFDEVFYAWDLGRGIRVDMGKGTVRDGFGGLDRLFSIESVVGTYRNDRFVDAAGAQRFNGEDGNDVFSLSRGNDTVTGGFGEDTFKFLGRDFGTDRIMDFEKGTDVIHLTGVSTQEDMTISKGNGNLVITVGTSKVILDGMAGLVLDPSDFIFG